MRAGEEELELVIAPGQSHGQKIVFSQAGDQEPGITPGDIVFILHELPHETFRRKARFWVFFLFSSLEHM